MTRLFRSLIFVPGNNSRFLEKAKSLHADIICFDLEDSVPIEEKKTARNLIKNALKNKLEYNSEIYVRTNSPTTDMIFDDLNEVIQKDLDGIVIPKVNTAMNIKNIEKIMTRLEKKRKLKPLEIIASIESSTGVVNAHSIASCKRVSALIFGVFDLLNDLHIEYTKNPEGAMYSRAKIPIDARAAGKYAIDAIWQDLNDVAGFKQDSLTAKNLGYVGKSIIHPDQIEIIHKIFYPTQKELDWATQVVEAYNLAQKNKKGATLVDGKMIDEVHYKQAIALINSIIKK